jgi:hypothetical protein
MESDSCYLPQYVIFELPTKLGFYVLKIFLYLFSFFRLWLSTFMTTVSKTVLFIFN